MTTWLIIVAALAIIAALVIVGWIGFVWMVCSISAIADDAAYQLTIFRDGLDGTDDQG